MCSLKSKLSKPTLMLSTTAQYLHIPFSGADSPAIDNLPFLSSP